MTAPRLRRRGWMQLASAAGAGWALSGPSRVLAQQIGFDQQRTVADMLQSLIGANLVREQGVSLSVAALADNGTLVPVTVDVTSPMTEQDHVTHLYLLSQRNPVTLMAVFHLGPWSGIAHIGTRVRLAGTQEVVALARLSNGGFWYDQMEIIVTESACVDAS